MSVRGVNFALPGAYGLNTQSEIADTEEFKYATLATNGVVDQSGKLVSRKDFVLQTAGFSGNVEQVYTHRLNDGTEVILSASGGKIYTGTSALTQRYDNSASSTTANSWQFASLSSKIFGFQVQQSPFVLNETTFATESFTGAPWTKPNVIMAAVGRLWAADDEAASNRYTVWWSNLLDGKVWNGASDAGSIDVRRAWPNGQDSIIALEFLSGRLIIFGRNAILMYTLPADNDPADMTLTDVVENIGCVARDSVVVAGGSIYFLSHDGYYRIAPLAQVTSLLAPLKVTKLVADDFTSSLSAETLTKVRAGFNPVEKFVVLALPTGNVEWCFHIDRGIPQIEVPPATRWTNVSNPFRAFCYDKDGNWYCGMTNGVGKYTGYTPDGASSVYSFEFYTQWNGFGDETRLKHGKTFALTVKTNSGQTGTFRWQTDYKEGTTRTRAFTCSSTEFAEAPGIGIVKGAIGSTFNTARFGFTMPINGNKVTLHSLRVYAKPGVVKSR
jgi:hypothetical protein